MATRIAPPAGLPQKVVSNPPNQTLYVTNLPSAKIQKDDLHTALYMLFSTYGPVLDVVALKTMKMRGQAHIVYRDIQTATQAMRSLDGMEFLGRKMVGLLRANFPVVVLHTLTWICLENHLRQGSLQHHRQTRRYSRATQGRRRRGPYYRPTEHLQCPSTRRPYYYEYRESSITRFASQASRDGDNHTGRGKPGDEAAT